ncbi:MAG: sulfotransferase domain-containing protein [Geminicoccaceae bacterium]|nr:sulfotransferase domain-containing protein [Geminicoccaceae bacterium]MDW8340622.1 sulfotransferase domain-containing protein [Geminicoccaceae bacterium]
MFGLLGLVRRSLVDRRRAFKRRLKFARGDVIVVSHAKSGRTWLATMISQVYHQRYGLPENELVQFDNFHRRDPRVPRILFVHDNVKRGPEVGLLPFERYARKKIVLLVRDPRDVAVSAWFQKKRNQRKPDARVAPVRDGRPLDMSEYVIEVKLPRIIAFLRRWADWSARLPRVLVVRYEDLRARPEEELGRVMAFVDDRPASPAELARAVAFAAFDRMREREAQGFFATDKLRPGARHDPDSFKVRRGVVGGWRDYFGPEEIARIDALMHEPALARFGYRPSSEPTGVVPGGEPATVPGCGAGSG